jgi:hypothetical protein
MPMLRAAIGRKRALRAFALTTQQPLCQSLCDWLRTGKQAHPARSKATHCVLPRNPRTAMVLDSGGGHQECHRNDVLENPSGK